MKIVRLFYNCPTDDIHKVFILPENEANPDSPPVKECPVCHTSMNFVGVEAIISTNPSPIPNSQKF